MDRMFSNGILHIEMLSLELCCKTERLTKIIEEAHGKDGSTNVANLEQLKCEEREILDCVTHLLQNIEAEELDTRLKSSKKEEFRERQRGDDVVLRTSPDCEKRQPLHENILLVEPTHCMNSFSDSGIYETEETPEEDSLFSVHDMMNGVSLPSQGKPLESVQELRETLRNLKRKTDKAVVEFLKQSRNVLHEEIKKQNHKDRDEKLLELISDLLLQREEVDEKTTETEVSCDKEDPLSIFEKSLCYVLIDKALLNCLLVLDKTQMEGTLMDCKLKLKNNLKSTGLLSKFSQAIEEKRAETRDDKEKDDVIEKMRCQIRELASEKLRLEKENNSLGEKTCSLEMKSDELEMQNSVIHEERQLLKEKVSFLVESMTGLHSGTERLRQQIETLEEQKEEVINEKNVLKEQLQNLKEEQKQYSNHESVKPNEDSSSEPRIPCAASTQTPWKSTSEEIASNGNDSLELLTSSTYQDDLMKPQSLSSEKDAMMASIESLSSENQELRVKLQSLEAVDKELRANEIVLTHAHHDSKEELQVARERSEILEQDLDERSTEIVLLQAHVLELKKTSTMAQERIRTMGNELRSITDGKDTIDGNNTILRRQKERLKVEVTTLLNETSLKNAVEKSDNIEELCRDVSSLRKHFVLLNKSVSEKEQTIEYLNGRATMSDQKMEEKMVLLDDLAKRNEVLVNKLEMMGAVIVVRNDCDVPDGYQEAVDGRLRSQSSMLEKGLLVMMKDAEEKENERKKLKEEQRRMQYNVEALETENILLKVQVSDLNESVEELEEDLVYAKCGFNGGHARSPGTPKSGGSGGHHVTFRDLGMEKNEGENLQALIETAKRRCIHLERQIRTNTSLLKTTQHRNTTLERTKEELRRENCCFRKCLSDFEKRNEIQKIKVSELEDQLNEANEGKSLDEMEKQSLEDRLQIMDGQTKYLKEEQEHLKDLVEALRKESKSSDEMQMTAAKQRQQGIKYSVSEKKIDEAFNGKHDFKYEMECLKNKVKRQSTHSRVLKCEIFEFLDDVRCMECELSCAVERRVQVTYKEVTTLDTTKVVSTWRKETSLCEQEGMAPVMAEILDLLKATIQRLQSAGDVPPGGKDMVDNAEYHEHTLLRERLREETAKLRREKERIQREVFVMKAIIEHLLNQTESSEYSSKAREEERSQKLRRQILTYVERNCRLENDILNYVGQQSALEEELEDLKENILNLKVRKDVLLSLNNTSNYRHCVVHKCHKSHERGARNFCFVKHETQELSRVGSEQDSDDVFSCPTDEGVSMLCNSPDREAGSCDSGYQGDADHPIRHVPTGHPLSLGSLYENTSKEPKLSEVSSASISEKKPKSILKKIPEKANKENSPSIVGARERNSITGCKVCNFSGLFKPFKRTNEEQESLEEYTMDDARRADK